MVETLENQESVSESTLFEQARSYLQCGQITDPQEQILEVVEETVKWTWVNPVDTLKMGAKGAKVCLMMKKCGVNKARKLGKSAHDAANDGDYDKAIELMNDFIEGMKQARERVDELQDKYSKDDITKCKKTITYEMSVGNKTLKKFEEQKKMKK